MTEIPEPDSQPPQDVAGDPVPMAQRVKFCPQCGQPKTDPDSPCLYCANNPSPFVVSYPKGKRASLVRQAIVFYTAMLVTSMFFMILNNELSGKTSPFLQEVVTSAVFSGVIAFFACFHVKTLFWLVFRRFNPIWILATIPIAVGTTLFGHLIITLLGRLGVPAMQYLDVFEGVPHGRLWAVLLICVQPALFEEIAFRGGLHTNLSAHLTRAETIVVGAFMFAILHLSIVSIPHLILLGLILGWLRNKTGSMIAGMFLHFFHNFFVLCLELYGVL